MGKEARLSFRISEHLSDRVDKAITESVGQIKDRSEFGTKAIKFYLDYIENTKAEGELIMEAILALARQVGERSVEIGDIQDLVDQRKLVPSMISSAKLPETHPDFEKLVGLFEMLEYEDPVRKELTTVMKDMAYDDVAEVYRKYSDKFFTRQRAIAK